MAISNTPWSDYKESDYSVEQWHRACLVHLHQGAPTSKNECKLPVRTPDGALNRNGVHAAAAALAGARGGMNISPEQKAAAARAIVRCYNQLDEKPPPSMAQSDVDRVDNFLTHISIRETSGKGGKFEEAKVKRDGRGKFAKKAENANLDEGWLAAQEDLMKNLWIKNSDGIEEMLTAWAATKGISDPNEIWGDPELTLQAAKKAVDYLNDAIPQDEIGVSPSGTKRLEAYLRPDAASVKDPLDVVRSRVIPYSGPNPHRYETSVLRKDYRFEKQVLRDANLPNKGHFHFNPNAVLDPSRVHQAGYSEVDNFLAHFGRKGMKWGQRIFSRVTGGNSKGGEGDKSGESSSTKKGSTEPTHDDAVAFLKAAQTPPNQLSTKEIQDAVQRANFMKQYNAMVAQDPNAELRQRVESLQLRKQYGQLQAEMNPSKTQQAQRFIKQVSDGYDSYEKLDKATGGMLNNTIRKSLGLPAKKPSRNQSLQKEVDTLSLEAKRQKLLDQIGTADRAPRHAKGVTTGKHAR